MDTRHLVDFPPTAAPAPAETFGPQVPSALSTRREFCVAACQALSLGAIAATLQACGGGNSPNEPSGDDNLPALPSLNATVTNGAATLTVDGTSLAATGGAAMVNSGLGTMLVVRTDASSVAAYSATCTHQQCTINGFGGNLFQCPCHGSQFNASTGAVVRGPASQPLRRFTASISNGVVSISA